MSKREKLKLSNKKIEEKRKIIAKKKEEEEIKRLKQSHSLKLTSMYFKLAKNHERIQKAKMIKNRIEKQKILKEKKIEEENSKSFVIENIKNFYTDRINELKEKIRNEQACNNILRYEQKQVLSSLKKERKETKKNDSSTIFNV